MGTKVKVFAGELRSIPSDGSRQGSAVVYVYGAADQDPLLDELFTRRDDLKLRWAHGISPEDIIGKIVSVRFLDSRVEIDFQLFKTPQADKVYELMLLGGLTEFSVGFAFEERHVYRGKDDRWHVRRAELTEVSAVPSGANRETMLTAIKSAAPALSERERLVRKIRELVAADDAAALRRGLHSPVRAASSPPGDFRDELERVKARIRAISDLGTPATPNNEIVREFWNDLELERKRDREAAERRKAARRRLEEFHVTRMGRGSARVIVDARMRPVYVEGETEREADWKAGELAKAAAREEEHEREAAERERVEALPAGDGIRRYDIGGVRYE